MKIGKGFYPNLNTKICPKGNNLSKRRRRSHTLHFLQLLSCRRLTKNWSQENISSKRRKGKPRKQLRKKNNTQLPNRKDLTNERKVLNHRLKRNLLQKIQVTQVQVMLIFLN